MIKLNVMYHGNVFFFTPCFAWVTTKQNVWSLQFSFMAFTAYVEVSRETA